MNTTGVGVLAFLVLLGIAVVLELRTTKDQEERRIKRQDKAMSKIRDDPNEPARWVP